MMRNIVDFHCTYDNSAGAGNTAAFNTGLKFPEAYESRERIAELAMVIKDYERAAFCRLPFCHTLEGEAMGGSVNPGDGIFGPRVKDYVCSDMAEILELRGIDYTAGRIGRVLEACRFLREKGEEVVLEISGPFTILNALIDPRVVFRTFKKNPEGMRAVFIRLRQEIHRYFEEALSAGVSMISYADPCGGLNILGPRLAEQAADIFTYPFLKDIEKIIGGKALVLLCPKTALALTGTAHAVWRELSVGRPAAYAEGCALAVGKANFVGQTCIKNKEYRLESGLIKAIDLI